MASPLINYDAFTSLPANPSPEQLARWLDDGRGVLRDAAGPLRLYDAIESGRSTVAQRRRLLGRLIDGARAQLGGLAGWLADNLASGRATLNGWFKRFSDVAAAHNYAGVMAAVGTVDPTPADRKAADKEVAKQLGFLARFREQLRTGAQPLYNLRPDPETKARVVSGTFRQRSEMYGEAAWSVAQNVIHEKMIREGYKTNRRILGGKHHCRGCLGENAKGWRPIGAALPYGIAPIGSQECKTRCRCTIEYSHDDVIADVLPLGNRPA